MIVKLLLDRKREGRELAQDEIRALVAAYTRGEVPDYQMAAFAMAVCCKGMTDAETLALTTAMRDSGECLSWDDLPVPTADKPDAGRDWGQEKGTTEDETAGWHHGLDGREFE